MILKKAGVSELENSTTQGRMKPPVGATLKTAHPLANGLVGAWLFNEGTGTTLNDYSGNGNHGTLTGSSHLPTWSGVHNGSILFDGIDDYVSISPITTANSSFTLSFIFNCLGAGFTGNTSYGGLIKCFNGVTSQRNRLNVNTSGTSIIFQADNGETHGVISDKFTSCFRKITNIVVTWDGSLVNQYKNNSSILATPYSLSAPLIGGANAPTIGWGANTQDYFFYGYISNVMIYNRALSAAEISVLYQYPYCMFY